MLVLSMLTAIGASQESWNSSEDWMSIGPVYHIGPYYYPNSDLSIGTQRFLNTYPSYMPLGYTNYYQTYKPIGDYIPAGNYLLGYNNPYFYDPQAGLDRAIANHAYQKFWTNHYSRYYWNYGNYP